MLDSFTSKTSSLSVFKLVKKNPVQKIPANVVLLVPGYWGYMRSRVTRWLPTASSRFNIYRKCGGWVSLNMTRKRSVTYKRKGRCKDLSTKVRALDSFRSAVVVCLEDLDVSEKSSHRFTDRYSTRPAYPNVALEHRHVLKGWMLTECSVCYGLTLF